MTTEERKALDQKLDAEIAKLLTETQQLNVKTFLAPALAAAALIGATAAATAAIINLFS